MTLRFNCLLRISVLSFFVLTCTTAFAQDGKMYPLDAPKEANAIPLNTGGVKDQPAKESWFRQWGDPMARNVSECDSDPVSG